MVCAPREDDVVELRNTNGDVFEESSFSISKQIAELEWGGWTKVINSAKTLALVSNGHWENYFKAPALRLQAQFPDIRLQGARIVTHGTIPIGSGLSSSSAIVVGASEALIAVNSLPVYTDLQVDLCGQGEWFVGTRGGSGDHAAIKLGRRGQIMRFSFLPFAVCGSVPFISGYAVVVCNSGVQAKKSEAARDTFNSKVLGYVIGEVLFKRLYPQYGDRIERMRDINPENLAISDAELYEMLKAIPQSITWSEMLECYGPFSPEDCEKLETVRGTLSRPEGPFEGRGVMLLGLAEYERGKRCVEYLEREDAEGLGRLWYISHNGDRVVAHDEALHPAPWDYVVDDEYLDGLIAALNSGDAGKAAQAQLLMQPGSYGCSTPEIDKIVDLAKVVPGVKGAQMAGAGLGGCVMILVEEPACNNLIETLAGHGFAASRYEFVEGAGLVVM